MTLERYLRDREKWQDSTIERIRKRILFKSANVLKTHDSEKLVAIYGAPQIGKTTLILFLLGIDSKYQKEVYNTLRAGVPRGNSSTSTAIIYQQIDADKYGVKYGEGLSDIEFCTEQHLKQRIQEIRKKVENEEASKDILHIYIPKKFFNDRIADSSGINIVDLPGDGSRNIKEKAHVEAMINKYMTLATVNIIACKANEINSLSELELPINVDWRNIPHKYLVVITNAYGQGTIKKYFAKVKNDRGQNFYEYMMQEYSKNMSVILGSLSQVEYFPIDIGDSLNRLINDSGLSQDDQKEVTETTNKVAAEIRKSIQKRHGNSLKSTMLDFKAYSSEYAEHHCSDLLRKISDVENIIADLEDDTREKENIVKKVEQKIEELQLEYESYIQLEKVQVKLDISASFNSLKTEVNGMSRKGIMKDSDRKALSVIQEILIEFVVESYRQYSIPILGNSGLITYEKINSDVGIESELAERFYSGGLFSKKIKSEEFIDLAGELFVVFCERLTGIVQAIISKQILERKQIKDEYLRYRQWKKESLRNIENNQSKIELYHTDLQSLNEEYSKIIYRKNADIKLINDYLQIAEDEFQKYKNELMEKINSGSFTAEENVCIMIYLCLLEKDYQSIVEMG